ncbi:MAG: pyridoxal phosphate-dependent aminotransferase family protein [Candidatus Omnitrophica bacterium]|nr:pyridoxal phosphate-dependent aminotransferase family protein [Candidatus Omnitrophota bacterium]
MQYIYETIREFKQKISYPDIPTLESAADVETNINGKKVLLFCSNNYLGLANHPAIKQAAIAAIDRYGVSTCASRLVAGNTLLHNELESTIANFLHRDASVVFSTGYMTNSGAIVALALGINMFRNVKKETVIISDELNHASIVDGCRPTKTKIEQYPHKDMKKLEAILTKHRHERKIIVTDAVFSMDGDMAPLPDMVILAKKYDALLMVDEAHSIGILGKTGRGILEHFGLPWDSVDILMGTLSKAAGSVGGFIAGSQELIDFLRIIGRSYMFTAALPPPTAAAAIASFNYIKTHPELVKSLHDNAEYLRSSFRKNNFDILDTETPIVPLIIGSEEKAIAFSRQLLAEGILACCIRWPAVEKNKARIRLVLMSDHTIRHLDTLVDKCAIIRKRLCC